MGLGVEVLKSELWRDPWESYPIQFKSHCEAKLFV